METDFGRTKGVLITGGGKRIGRAIAEEFAAAGWRVAVHYCQSQCEANALVKSLSGNGHCCVYADFRNDGDVQQLVSSLVNQGFPLKCLINSAAVYSREPFTAMSPEKVKEIYQVNFFAPFELMRQFRLLVSSGNIVNLLDQRVSGVDPAASVYNFSKKSLRDATEACAVSWAPRIRVNGIAPGIVLPPPGGCEEKMNRILHRIPMKERTTEKEIAQVAVQLADSRMTGNILYLDGGLHLTAGAETVIEK